MTARVWGLVFGLLALLAILGGLYAWGRSDGREAQAKNDAALIERKNTALRSAGQALGAAALRFREIDAVTEQAKKDADSRLKLAEDLTAQEKRERAGLANAIAEINAEKDNSPCRDVSVGVPLR